MNDPTCINLTERFGDRFRVAFDPAYDPKHRPKDKLEPWYMVLPCRFGEIYPHDDTQLVVEVDGRPKLKGRLARLDCCAPNQDGDDFGSFLFDVDDFAKVAEIVKPRRRRQVSAAERQRLAAMSAEHGFQSHQSRPVGTAP